MTGYKWEKSSYLITILAPVGQRGSLLGRLVVLDVGSDWRNGTSRCTAADWRTGSL